MCPALNVGQMSAELLLNPEKVKRHSRQFRLSEQLFVRFCGCTACFQTKVWNVLLGLEPTPPGVRLAENSMCIHLYVSRIGFTQYFCQILQSGHNITCIAGSVCARGWTSACCPILFIAVTALFNWLARMFALHRLITKTVWDSVSALLLYWVHGHRSTALFVLWCSVQLHLLATLLWRLQWSCQCLDYLGLVCTLQLQCSVRSGNSYCCIVSWCWQCRDLLP